VELVFEVFEGFFIVTPSLCLGKSDAEYGPADRFEIQLGWLWFNVRLLFP
jgi:hypothetical protein